MKTNQKTRVIFRKFPESGDIIALFPELPGDSNYFATFLSYQAIGQHGSASTGIIGVTTPATPEEFAPLLAELRQIGYSPVIALRMTYSDFKKRREACRGY